MANKLWSMISWVAMITLVSCDMAEKGAPVVSPGTQLPEWEMNFTFNGNPIHPAIIHRFEGWISDGGSIVVAIDIAAAEGTNEYRIPFSRDRDFIRCALPDTDPGESYEYLWVGRMADGTHVVRGTWVSSGTGRFETLYFFRFSVDEGYAVSGQLPQRRVILNITGYHLLGDRADPTVKIVDDHVDVIPRPASEDQFAGNVTAATLYPSGRKPK